MCEMYEKRGDRINIINKCCGKRKNKGGKGSGGWEEAGMSGSVSRRS